MLLKNYELTNREKGKKRRGRKRREKEGKGKEGRGENRRGRGEGEKGRKRKRTRQGKEKRGTRGRGTGNRATKEERQGTEEGGEGEKSTGKGRGCKVQCNEFSASCQRKLLHITSQAKQKVKSCNAAQVRIMVMAHSCMRKYKRISKSAPILVQCNVFWKTHIHIREESWKWKHWTSTSTVFQSVSVACNKVGMYTGAKADKNAYCQVNVWCSGAISNTKRGYLTAGSQNSIISK